MVFEGDDDGQKKGWAYWENATKRSAYAYSKKDFWNCF